MTNEIFRNEEIVDSEESLFKKFFSSTGRINRRTFFIRSLLIFFVEALFLSAVVFVSVLADLSLTTQPLWIDVSFAMVTIVALIPEYFLSAKRLHDIGKDETLAKIFFGIGILTSICIFSTINAVVILSKVIGISSVVFQLYLLFKRGESNNNEYGAAQ